MAFPQHGSNHADRLAIWRADLESIRRETPVLDRTRYPPEQVIAQPRTASQAPAGPATSGQTSVTSAAQCSQADPVVILDSDSDDDGGHEARDLSLADALAFYGQQGQERATAISMTKYQDPNLALQGKYPSRRNGFGFDMDQLRRDTNWAVPSDAQVTATWDKDTFASSPPLGLEDAVTRNWSNDLWSGGLLRGLPLVEEVEFFHPGNYTGASSACFFKALAYLVYGDHTFNQRVQAEHLQYYGDVLEWADHPRYQLYKRMNRKFYDTVVTANGTDVSTVGNFFQLLSIPQAWIPLDLLDVSADLYNLFIVVYTIRRRANLPAEVTEVSTKGSYNARHVCLLFNGFHYQPMVPNEFLASEFTFPRITYENVRSLPSSGDTDQGKASIDLKWRNTWGRGLDRKKGALPVDHVFYVQTLTTTMRGSYPPQ